MQPLADVQKPATTQPASKKTTAKPEAKAQLPVVLSAPDVALYKRLFTAQRNLDRATVAELLPHLANTSLVGHLMAERLLNPSVRPPFTDLKAWLQKYPDHPQAWQMYELALKRKPKGASVPVPTLEAFKPRRPRNDDDDARDYTPSRERTRLLGQLQRLREQKRLVSAVELFNKPSTRRIVGTDAWARAGTRLARTLLSNGYFNESRTTAERVATADKTNLEAHWLAGFAAYRGATPKAAITHFENILKTADVDSTYYARASWWLARAYEKTGNKEKATASYRKALRDPVSFYGQLAAEKLNEAVKLNWQAPTLSADAAALIAKNSNLRRVIALSEIGEHGLAQRDLTAAYAKIPYAMDESLLAMALKLHLPGSALRLARGLRERDRLFLGGLYPIPDRWKPRGGFKVDSSLVLAIMRQESAFDPMISSRVGARGLMQLMPATAKYVQKNTGRSLTSSHKLFDPTLNMDLGQDYIIYLSDKLGGNPLHIIAAYNAGPGAVNRWVANPASPKKDPVEFMESIPFTETRGYVEKVLANLWMYQKRQGEPSVVLNALANHRWPTQEAVLKQGVAVR